MRALAVVVGVASLCACATLDLGTAWSYRNTDWSDVEPGGARVALTLPPGLASAARLSINARLEDEARLLEEAFVLRQMPADAAALPRGAVGTVVFGLPPEDVPRARRVIERFREYDQEKLSGATARIGFDLAFADVPLEAFCTHRDEEVRVWTRRTAGERFRALTKRRRMRDLMEGLDGCEASG